MDADPLIEMHLPDGLAARPVTMDDAEAAVSLFNRCDAPLAGANWHSVDETLSIWKHPDLELERDTLAVCDSDGRMIAYQQVWIEPPYVRHRLFGRVDPEHEGLGIGTAMFEWAERLALSRIDLAPDDALIRVQGWSLAGHGPTRRLLADHRMDLVRHSLNMAMDLADLPASPSTGAPAWPDGVEVRPFETGQYRQLYLAHREAFRDHSGNAEADVETGYDRFRKYFELDELHDPKLWYVAWDGDEIAGFALCRREAYEDPEMAWVLDLAVRRPWRRQGLGAALLGHAFSELRALGRPRVGLSVDAQSLTGATRLYEKVGMHVTLTIEVYERQLRAGRDYETASVDG